GIKSAGNMHLRSVQGGVLSRHVVMGRGWFDLSNLHVPGKVVEECHVIVLTFCDLLIPWGIIKSN
ncbi:hypothetical protein L9F63_019224, partial [Diploptera punctata]